MTGADGGKRVALVAGGAGGIGSAISRRFADDGFDVVIADLDEERVVRLADELGSRRHVVADLATEAGVAEAVRVACDGGRLAALTCALGISPKKNGHKRPFHEIDVEEWNRVMAVNLTSPFLLAKAAYPHLEPEGGGIVIIGSAMAKLGASGPEGASFPPWSPSGAHYAASKAAVSNLIVSIARELAPARIRCNGVAPGYIAAGTTGGMGGSAASDVDAVMRSQVPLGRAGTTDEVAKVVAFLTSEAATYITGEIVDVDGGWVPD